MIELAGVGYIWLNGGWEERVLGRIHWEMALVRIAD
jgi:hypothetical protein